MSQTFVEWVLCVRVEHRGRSREVPVYDGEDPWPSPAANCVLRPSRRSLSVTIALVAGGAILADA